MALILVKCVGNNSPRYDGKTFYERLSTITTVNSKEVHNVTAAEHKPGDSVIIKHGKGSRLWHGIIADDVGAASLASSHERTKTTVEAATPVGFMSGQLETQPSKPRESQQETQGSGETPMKRRRTKARPVEVTTVAGASPVVSSGRVSQKEILDGKSPAKRRRTNGR